MHPPVSSTEGSVKEVYWTLSDFVKSIEERKEAKASKEKKNPEAGAKPAYELQVAPEVRSLSLGPSPNYQSESESEPTSVRVNGLFGVLGLRSQLGTACWDTVQDLVWQENEIIGQYMH
ncbi:hypothetical protein BT96DRAFT_942397 [Gymnopus androsaceus JB14]|uniref:Uncharacterized protein n=1 Tax=Gymnopus androsaceus JB14 TaxID=1447944 RepID=A0A6A4HCL3_9AGAR|nr:hypothetical protein BT96DRAFT_942397 [Gymnopus androsaceus JB14]